MDQKLAAVVAKYAVAPTATVERLPVVVVVPSFDVPLPRPARRRKGDPDLPAKEAVRVAAKTVEELASLRAQGDKYVVDTTEDAGVAQRGAKYKQVPIEETPAGLHEAHDAFKKAYGVDSGEIQGAKQLFKEVDSPNQGQFSKRDTEVTLPTTALMNSHTAAKLGALLTEYDKQVVSDSVQMRNYVTNRLLEVSTCGETRFELRALELLGKISDVGLFSEKTEITVTHTASSLEHEIKDSIKRLMGKAGMVEDAEFEEVSNGGEEGFEISESGSSGVQQTQENSEPS